MGLTAADWVLFFVYVAIIVYVGWRTGKAQKNTNQFFLAPSGLSPFIIGTSLFATLLSTISYLSLPGETINKGPMHLTRLFAYPLVFIVVGYWLRCGRCGWDGLPDSSIVELVAIGRQAQACG